MALITLTPFSTVTLGASTANQLVPSSKGGHYDLTLLNTGTAAIYISNSNSVAANATSFALPPNLAVTIVISAPSGVWVNAGGTAGSVSALLQPRGQ